MKRLVPLLLLLLLLVALPAQARESGHDLQAADGAAVANAAHEHDVTHQAHTWLFGFRGSSQMPLASHAESGEHGEEGGLALEPGVGVFAAWVANPGLELELAGRMVFAEEHLLVPLELMVKHPFGHDTLQPYVGAGPTVVLSTAEEGHAAFGLSTVAGSYLWLAPSLGFLLETNLNFLVEDELTPELAVALGFVTAF